MAPMRVLDTLSAWLRDRTYVAGDHFTAADVLLASHLQWGMMTGLIEKRRAFERISRRTSIAPPQSGQTSKPRS